MNKIILKYSILEKTIRMGCFWSKPRKNNSRVKINPEEEEKEAEQKKLLKLSMDSARRNTLNLIEQLEKDIAMKHLIYSDPENPGGTMKGIFPWPRVNNIVHVDPEPEEEIEDEIDDEQQFNQDANGGIQLALH